MNLIQRLLSTSYILLLPDLRDHPSAHILKSTLATGNSMHLVRLCWLPRLFAVKPALDSRHRELTTDIAVFICLPGAAEGSSQHGPHQDKQQVNRGPFAVLRITSRTHR